mmetsp:Transcript_19296/g.33384  ORF Transcript_19296/g.33384 Transcript_19296/m.33384 type:complete len:283 (+) Transcript_19296:715-1563(+)
MCQGLVGRVTVLGVDLQQIIQQILGRGRETRRPFGETQRELLARGGLAVNLAAIVVKRQAATEQHKDNHAQSPHVDGLVITVPLQHLRGQITLCAEEGARHGLALHHLGEAKINQLDLRIGAFAGEKEILGLEITVNNVKAVHVRHRRGDFAHQHGGFFFAQGAFLHDVVKQFAALHHFHDDINAVGALEGVFQADDVRVIQRLQHFDLHKELVQQARELHLHLSLVDHFAGIFRAVGLLHTLVALGGTTNADFFSQFIVHVECCLCLLILWLCHTILCCAN